MLTEQERIIHADIESADSPLAPAVSVSQGDLLALLRTYRRMHAALVQITREPGKYDGWAAGVALQSLQG